LTAARLEWESITDALDRDGYATTAPILSAADCARITALYDEPEHWRTRVVMQRLQFGSGEYQYFRYPLPPVVAELRAAFYPRLAPVANAWHERLGLTERFPAELAEFLERCHAAGQARPTPLVLRYRQGDHNRLHQDIYGEHAFPLQVAVALARPGADYTGGEFLLVENIPRAQSRGTAITLQQGEAVIWPTRYRPGKGQRGYHRIGVRHGVSVLRSGHRHTLGVIFHDAT
jgi:hypothetical protein